MQRILLLLIVLLLPLGAAAAEPLDCDSILVRVLRVRYVYQTDTIHTTVYVVDTLKLETDLRHLQAVVIGAQDSLLRMQFVLCDTTAGGMPQRGAQWDVFGKWTVSSVYLPGDTLPIQVFVNVLSATAVQSTTGYPWSTVLKALQDK